MRPVRLTVVGVDVSPPIPIDQYLGPTSIAVGIVINTGATGTYTVEHTFDDVFDENFNPATATWFDNDDVALVGATTNQDGNYAFPPSAVRLNVTVSNSDPAGITINLIQAGAAS